MFFFVIVSEQYVCYSFNILYYCFKLNIDNIYKTKAIVTNN